jgi:hypothetical protein
MRTCYVFRHNFSGFQLKDLKKIIIDLWNTNPRQDALDDGFS